MRVSIIIPCFNERNTVSEIIKKLIAIPYDKEIIVVDDGSTDGTVEILKEFNFNPVKLLFHGVNIGKGSAIRTALKSVSGDIVVIQDADLEYDPNEYHKLIEPIISGRAQVVYGSRILKKNNPICSRKFYIGGRFLTFLANLLYKANITDEPTCYKAFEVSLLNSLNLRCNRFEFCPEVTAKIRKRNIPIYEVPISYNPRKLKEGKKIGWRDGIEAVWTLLKYRFID